MSGEYIQGGMSKKKKNLFLLFDFSILNQKTKIIKKIGFYFW